MTVEKRGKKWRIKEMVNGKYIYATVDFDPNRNKKKAIAIIEEKKKQLNSFSNPESFEEAFRHYIAIKDKVLSPSTIRGYFNIFNQLPDYVLKCSLNDIDQMLVQRFINEYSASHSPKSCINAHGLIVSVVKMHRPGFALNTTLPQKDVKPVYIPSDEEVRMIFDNVRDTEYEIPFALATLGLRVSEICGASPLDIEGNILHITKAMVLDIDNNSIVRNHNKNNTSTRDVLLPDFLADKIKSAGVICTVRPCSLNRKLHKVCKSLGIEAFNFHKFRHYFASYAHSIGMSDADIMAMGGWKTDNIMKAVYRHAMNIEESQKAASLHISTLLM